MRNLVKSIFCFKSFIIAGLMFAIGFISANSAQAAKCGAAGQRPCKVFERIPSCNKGLFHSFKLKRCMPKTKKKPVICGGPDQRPCKVFERVPSCKKGLGHDFKLKKCVQLRRGQSSFFYGLSSASSEVANLERVCQGLVSKLPRIKTGVVAFDRAAGCQIQYQAGYRCAAPMLFKKLTKSSNFAGRLDAAMNTPQCKKVKGPLKTLCAIGAVVDQAAIRPTVCLAKVMANGGFQDISGGSSKALGQMCQAAGRLTFEMTIDRLLKSKNNYKGYKETLFKAAKNARKYSKKGAKIERFFEKLDKEPACRGVFY